MTESEAREMLQAKLTCIEKENKPICSEEGCDRNCDECNYCYAQGTMVEQKQALAMAIKALEKQIAKKVVRPKGLLNEYYHEEECPHCKTEFKVHVAGYRYTQAVGETHYCPNCGQRLLWE